MSVAKRQACLEGAEGARAAEPTVWEQVNEVVNSCLLFLRNDQDSVHFEESCRRQIGTGGYVLYTLDKVVTDCFEQIVYSINQPTGARNYQAVFWNISYTARHNKNCIFQAMR